MEARARRLDLATLLAPLSVDDFLRKYWARQALHVKGTPEKYRDFFDRSRFELAVARASASGAPVKMRATFDSQQKGPGRVPQLSLTSGQVRQAYAAGATVCVTAIHEHDDELERFVSGIRAELGYPGVAGVNSYLSPHGCGFGMHFDAKIACTLQLEGSKWWTFSHDAAVPWPLGNAAFDEGRALYYEKEKEGEGEWKEARAFSESEYSTVLLEPGDFLALPAGTWHSARAEGHSLALNLAFDSIDVTAVISNLLHDHFESDARWRAVPPRGQGRQAAADDYLKSRIDEAIRFLESVKADGEPARRAWGRLVMASTSRINPRVTAEAGREVCPTDTLRIPEDAVTFTQEVDGGAILKVHVDSHTIDVDGSSRVFLREILARRSFTAEDSRSWFGGRSLSWPEAREALQALVDDGILEIVR